MNLLSIIKRKLNMLLLMVLSLITILPIWFVISGSFMGSGEFTQSFSAVLSDTSGKVSWPLIPNYPTLRSYIELLIDPTRYLVVFWKSSKHVIQYLI